MAPRKAAAKTKKPTVKSIQKEVKKVVTSKVILKKIDLQDPNLLTLSTSGGTKRSLRSRNERAVPAKLKDYDVAPSKSTPAKSLPVPAKSTKSKPKEVVAVSPRPTISLRTKNERAVPARFKNNAEAPSESKNDEKSATKVKEPAALSKSKEVPKTKVPPPTRSLRTRDERSVPVKLKDSKQAKVVPVNKDCVVVLEKCVDPEPKTTKSVRTRSRSKFPENDSDVIMLSDSSENEEIAKTSSKKVSKSVTETVAKKIVSPTKSSLSKSTGQNNSRSLRSREERQIPLKLRVETKESENRLKSFQAETAPSNESFEVRVMLSPIKVPEKSVTPVKSTRSLRNPVKRQLPLKLRDEVPASKKNESKKHQKSNEQLEVRLNLSPIKIVPEKSVKNSRKHMQETENEKKTAKKQKTVPIKKNPVVVLKSPLARRMSIDYQPASSQLEKENNQSALTDFFQESEKNFNIPKSPSKKIVSSPKKPVYKDSVVLNSSESLQSEDETEKDHVFDFLSNSQSNGSENDVATKKLLLDLKKKGKITIKTRRKRKIDTGKPPAPKKRKVPTKKPLMTSTPNKFVPTTSKALHKPIVKPVLTNNEIIIGDDDFHDYEDEVVPPSPPPIINSIRNQTSDSLFNAIASTSKIIPIPNPVVQKLKGNVPAHSTPQKRADLGSFNSNNSFVSPIQHKSIPWRVDTLKVPSVFNFHRSSDLTPSYSSDVIPYDPNAIREQEIPEVVERSSTRNNSDMENVNPNVSVSKSPKKSVLAQRTPLKELSIQNLSSPKRKQQSVNPRRQTKYFGFDDFDDEDESLMFGNQENVFECNNTTLKEKLSALKKIQIEKPTRIDARILHDVFKSPEKPTDIRKAIKDVPAVKQLEFEELPSEVEDTIVDLFSDPEQPPLNVTKSIVENARRSYTRVPKPRRYNVDYDHNFDEDSEDEEEVQKKRRKKNTGHNQAQKKELNKFVHEFNSMCEDVETFDLCVESD